LIRRFSIANVSNVSPDLEIIKKIYSDYCIKSWSAWCRKNDIDFLVIDEHDDRYKYPVWNKDIIFERVGDQYFIQ
jgi:2-hydroxy-3-keto-5-methylthiopentenyl-1-phosphate phosphatase